MKKSKTKEKLIDKIIKRYEFSWERFKYLGFTQLFIIFITIFFVLGFFVTFANYYRDRGAIPLEVLVLIVLGVQAFFMLLQTGFFSNQNKFLKMQNAPQLIPYIDDEPSTNKTHIYLKNTRENEAHNVRYIIEIFSPKRKILKRDSIGTITKNDKVALTNLSSKDFFQKKIILEFFYDDVTSIAYSMRFMKKKNRKTILFVGFR